MEDEDLKSLFSAVSNKFDIGSFEDFKAKMQTPEARKSFYDVVSNKGLDLGDYNQYETRLKKNNDSQPTAPIQHVVYHGDTKDTNTSLGIQKQPKLPNTLTPPDNNQNVSDITPIPKDEFLQKVNAGNLTDDLKIITTDPKGYKDSFLKKRDLFDEGEFDNITAEIKTLQPKSIFEVNSNKFVQTREKINKLQDRIKEFRLNRIKNEKAYTEDIQNTIEQNNGKIDYLSPEHIKALGLNSDYLKTNALKVNGEDISAFNLKQKLFDGDFISDLHDGKANITIDKNSQIVKDGTLPEEYLNDIQTLTDKQSNSGTQAGDIIQFLGSTLTSTASSILKVGPSTQEAILNDIGNEDLKAFFESNPFYKFNKGASKHLDQATSYLQDLTREYQGGIAKSFKDGNYIDGAMQITNSGAQMLPLIALSAIQPELAPALFGLSAYGETLDSLNKQQDDALNKDKQGIDLTKEEQTTSKYNALQKLANAGATGLMNWYLFGGLTKNLAVVSQAEKLSGKSLTELSEGLKYGIGKGFVKFGKEVVNQEKFFLKMNLGGETINLMTGVNTDPNFFERLKDDAIKGVAFAIPFYAHGLYNNNKALKDARNGLINKMLSISAYDPKETELFNAIGDIRKSLENKDLSESNRKIITDHLIKLSKDNDILLKTKEDLINNIPFGQKLEFAQRYENILEFKKGVDEIGKDTKTGQSLMKEYVKLTEDYKTDLGNATEINLQDINENYTRLVKEAENVGVKTVEGKQLIEEAEALKAKFNELTTKGEVIAEPKLENTQITEVAQKPQPVIESIDDNGIYIHDGKKGKITTDGQQVVFETKDEIIELGNKDELTNTKLDEFSISKEVELNIKLDDKNHITIDGKKYFNNYIDPQSAITKTKDGYSVSLETENGEKRNFRGQRAEEIVYQYKLKKFEDNVTEQKHIDEANRLVDEEIRIEEETRAITPKRKNKSVRKAKQRTLEKVVEPVSKNDIQNPKKVDETQAQGGVTANRDIRPKSDTSNKQGEGKDVQSSVDVNPDKGKVKIKVETKPNKTTITDLDSETDFNQLMNGEAGQRRKDGQYSKDGITYKRQNPKDNPKGKEGTVKFSDTENIEFRYELMEADDVQPAHIGGNRNPNFFITEAQPKNRTDEASQKQSDKIADKPNFDEVSDNTLAYSGAPIVNERGEVIQGNNRSEGLKKHYNSGKTEYKKDLLNNADKFGLTNEQVNSLKNPILVRVLKVSDTKAIDLGNLDVKDIETGGKRRIDPIATGRRIPSEKKSDIANILFKDNSEQTLNSALRDKFGSIINILKDYINEAQLTSLMNKYGEPIPEGLKDLETLVQHFLFENSNVGLPDMFENMSHIAKEGLIKSLPKLLSVNPKKSILPDIQGAINAYHLFSKSGSGDFDAWVKQSDMFNEGTTPADKFNNLELEIAKKLLESKAQKDIITIFTEYNELVNGKEGDMFNESTLPISKIEAIEKLFNIKYNGKRNDRQSEIKTDISKTGNKERRQEDRGGKQPTTIPKRVSQDINGKKIEEDSRIKEITTRFKEGLERLGKELKGHELEDFQKTQARDYAKEHKIWVDDFYTLGRHTKASGVENTLAIDANDKFVYKRNNLNNSKFLISNLFDKVKLHNEVFPETKYDVVGFTGLKQEGNRPPNVDVILKQDYIRDAKQAQPKEIDDYMKSLGFEKISDAKYSNGKVEVSDLHPRNVLKDKDGDIYVVDAEFKDLSDSKPNVVEEPKLDLDIVEKFDLSKKAGINTAKDYIEKLEKSLKDFGDENLSMGLPIVVARGMVKAMKLAINTAKTGADLISAAINYVKGTEWYKNLTDQEKDDLIKLKIASTDPFQIVQSELKAEKRKGNLRAENLKETTRKLRKKFTDLTIFKKEIVKHIKEKLDAEDIPNLTKTDIITSMNMLNTLTNEKAVQKVLDKIDYKLSKAKLETASNKFDNTLKSNRDFLKKENKRDKAKTVDNTTRKSLETLREFKDKSSVDIDNKIAEVSGNLSEYSQEDLFALHIAKNRLEALQYSIDADFIKNTKNYSTKNTNLSLEDVRKLNEDKINRQTYLKDKSWRIMQDATNDLKALVGEGKSALKEQLFEESKRLQNITEEAVNATNHKYSDETSSTINNRKQKRSDIVKTMYKTINDLQKFFSHTVTSSYEYLTKYISYQHDFGDGFLYNKIFKEDVLNSKENYINEKFENSKIIEDNLTEIFDLKDKKIIDKFRVKIFDFFEKAQKIHDDTGIVLTTDRESGNQRQLSKLNALSVYLWSKMTGLTENLLQAGYDDIAIRQVENFLGADYKKLGDFMVDFLEKKHSGYSKVNLEVARTELGKVENYFPVSFLKESINADLDLNNSNPNLLASSLPNHSIERIIHKRPLDDSIDAYRLFSDYLEEMTHFKHYARTIKDHNAILSSKKFIHNLTTLTDDGSMYSQYKAATMSILGVKSPETPNKTMAGFEKWLYSLTKTLSVTYVGFKGVTALKQKLSAPAMLEYIDNAHFNYKGKAHPIHLLNGTKAMAELITIKQFTKKRDFNFFVNESTSFRERVKEGNIGNELISEYMNDHKQHSYSALFKKTAVNIQLAPNKYVDARVISTTGKIIYDQQYKKYIDNGVNPREAKRKAIRDFEVYFNSTQQSASEEYLGQAQREKGFMSSIGTPFRNSQFAYYRKTNGAIIDLTRSYAREKMRLEKLGIKDAGKRALKVLYSEKNIDKMKTFALYGWIMPMVWQYAASGLPGLITSWDDEDKKDMQRAAMFGFVDGAFIIGDYGKFIYDVTFGGKNWEYSPSLLIKALQDIGKDGAKTLKSTGDLSPQLAYLSLKYSLKFTGTADLDTVIRIYHGIEKLISDGNFSEEAVKDMLVATKSFNDTKTGEKKEQKLKERTPRKLRDMK